MNTAEVRASETPPEPPPPPLEALLHVVQGDDSEALAGADTLLFTIILDIKDSAVRLGGGSCTWQDVREIVSG